MAIAAGQRPEGRVAEIFGRLIYRVELAQRGTSPHFICLDDEIVEVGPSRGRPIGPLWLAKGKIQRLE
jgi:hypothetical protein